MNKVILALTLLAILTACGPDPNIVKTTSGESGREYIGSSVYRLVDTEARVVCWVYDPPSYGGGISCLPLADTALE